MNERVEMRIVGRVQGVWYRASAQAAARQRGITGWVRNTERGTVEAVFEGEPDMVDHMVWFCRDGPGSASVTRLEVDEEEPESLRGFRVK